MSKLHRRKFRINDFYKFKSLTVRRQSEGYVVDFFDATGNYSRTATIAVTTKAEAENLIKANLE